MSYMYEAFGRILVGWIETNPPTFKVASYSGSNINPPAASYSEHVRMCHVFFPNGNGFHPVQYYIYADNCSNITTHVEIFNIDDPSSDNLEDYMIMADINDYLQDAMHNRIRYGLNNFEEEPILTHPATEHIHMIPFHTH